MVVFCSFFVFLRVFLLLLHPNEKDITVSIDDIRARLVRRE